MRKLLIGLLLGIIILLGGCSSTKIYEIEVNFNKRVEVNSDLNRIINDIDIVLNGEDINMEYEVDITDIDIETVGEYVFTVSINGEEGTITSEPYTVNVVDTTLPVIVYTKQDFEIEDVMNDISNSFTCSDNYSTSNSLTTSLLVDDFDSMGPLHVTYTCTDEFSNTSVWSDNVNVINTNTVMINGVSRIYAKYGEPIDLLGTVTFSDSKGSIVDSGYRTLFEDDERGYSRITYWAENEFGDYREITSNIFINIRETNGLTHSTIRAPFNIPEDVNVDGYYELINYYTDFYNSFFLDFLRSRVLVTKDIFEYNLGRDILPEELEVLDSYRDKVITAQTNKITQLKQIPYENAVLYTEAFYNIQAEYLAKRPQYVSHSILERNNSEGNKNLNILIHTYEELSTILGRNLSSFEKDSLDIIYDIYFCDNLKNITGDISKFYTEYGMEFNPNMDDDLQAIDYLYENITYDYSYYPNTLPTIKYAQESLGRELTASEIQAYEFLNELRVFKDYERYSDLLKTYMYEFDEEDLISLVAKVGLDYLDINFEYDTSKSYRLDCFDISEIDLSNEEIELYNIIVYEIDQISFYGGLFYLNELPSEDAEYIKSFIILAYEVRTILYEKNLYGETISSLSLSTIETLLERELSTFETEAINYGKNINIGGRYLPYSDLLTDQTIFEFLEYEYFFGGNALFDNYDWRFKSKEELIERYNILLTDSEFEDIVAKTKLEILYYLGISSYLKEDNGMEIANNYLEVIYPHMEQTHLYSMKYKRSIESLEAYLNCDFSTEEEDIINIYLDLVSPISYIESSIYDTARRNLRYPIFYNDDEVLKDIEIVKNYFDKMDNNYNNFITWFSVDIDIISGDIGPLSPTELDAYNNLLDIYHKTIVYDDIYQTSFQPFYNDEEYFDELLLKCELEKEVGIVISAIYFLDESLFGRTFTKEEQKVIDFYKQGYSVFQSKMLEYYFNELEDIPQADKDGLVTIGLDMGMMFYEVAKLYLKPGFEEVQNDLSDYQNQLLVKYYVEILSSIYAFDKYFIEARDLYTDDEITSYLIDLYTWINTQDYTSIYRSKIEKEIIFDYLLVATGENLLITQELTKMVTLNKALDEYIDVQEYLLNIRINLYTTQEKNMVKEGFKIVYNMDAFDMTYVEFTSLYNLELSEAELQNVEMFYKAQFIYETDKAYYGYKLETNKYNATFEDRYNACLALILIRENGIDITFFSATVTSLKTTIPFSQEDRLFIETSLLRYYYMDSINDINQFLAINGKGLLTDLEKDNLEEIYYEFRFNSIRPIFIEFLLSSDDIESALGRPMTTSEIALQNRISSCDLDYYNFFTNLINSYNDYSPRKYLDGYIGLTQEVIENEIAFLYIIEYSNTDYSNQTLSYLPVELIETNLERTLTQEEQTIINIHNTLSAEINIQYIMERQEFHRKQQYTIEQRDQILAIVDLYNDAVSVDITLLEIFNSVDESSLLGRELTQNEEFILNLLFTIENS